jgi:hypothetical protein
MPDANPSMTFNGNSKSNMVDFRHYKASATKTLVANRLSTIELSEIEVDGRQGGTGQMESMPVVKTQSDDDLVESEGEVKTK